MISNETLLLVTLVVPFIGSVIASLLRANARNAEAWLAGSIALSLVVILSLFYPTLVAGQIVRVQVEWLPAAGVNFALRLDGFAWVFSLLITGVGFLVFLYARYYMSPKDPVPRFYSLLLAFMGSMLGVVLSGDL